MRDGVFLDHNTILKGAYDEQKKVFAFHNLRNNRAFVNIKNIFTIFLSYFSLSIIAFLIYPLIENISYIQQIKEGFLFLVYIHS